MIRPYAVLDPDRGIAAIEEAVRLSATLDDPLLHARTELLAAGIRIAYDTWRSKDWDISAAASETIQRLSDAPPLAFDRVIYAHLEADRFLQSALATAEPNLHALAWDVDARVAMAEKDAKTADEKIEKGLAVLQAFEIPTTAWRVHATRSDLYRQAKNDAAAEVHRARAEGIILALANSLAPDDPVRTAFLAAAPVRRIRMHPSGSDPTRSRAARRHDESRRLRHQRPHPR